MTELIADWEIGVDGLIGDQFFRGKVESMAYLPDHSTPTTANRN